MPGHPQSILTCEISHSQFKLEPGLKNPFSPRVNVLHHAEEYVTFIKTELFPFLSFSIKNAVDIVNYISTLKPIVMAEWIALLLCIWKLLGSDLSIE
jgi:hypothetical protein